MDDDDRPRPRPWLYRLILRWPLAIVGLVIIGWAVTKLSDQRDTSDARALLLGIGCVLLGAGLADIIRGGGRD